MADITGEHAEFRDFGLVFAGPGADHRDMFVSILIAFFAICAAVVIIGAALQRHRDEESTVTTWQDVKEAFAGHPIRGVRDEVQQISDPNVLESDMRLSELLAQAQDGTGYVEPHDILSLRSGRN